MPIKGDPDEIIHPATTIVTDLQYPPPGTFCFYGFLGRALDRPPAVAGGAAQKYWRLYLTATLTDYIEFQDADVLQNIQLGNSVFPLGGTAIWLKQDAKINYVHVETLTLQREFLQGGIAGAAAGAPSAAGQQQAGGATVLCGTGGATVLCGTGGATVLCGTGGATVLCGTGGASIIGC